MPCQPSGLISNKPSRRKNRKHSRTPYDMNKPKLPVGGKFSLTKTSEFTDSTDKIISDAAELQQMQDFITQKVISKSELNTIMNINRKYIISSVCY